MPIIPAYKHPLRRLRETLNLQQKELAEALGCSTRTVIAIENRTLRLSRELGMRAYFRFGVLPHSITTPIKGDKGFSRRRIDSQVPLGVDRKPYTRASKAAAKRDGREGYVLDSIFVARGLVDILLRSAALKGCFTPVYFSFLEWIDRCNSEFALADRASSVAESYEPPEKWAREVLYAAGWSPADADEIIEDLESLREQRSLQGCWSRSFVRNALEADEHLGRQAMWEELEKSASPRTAKH